MAYKQRVPLPVPEGGTGTTSLTNNGILIGSGTMALSTLSVATDGQLPIGSTGNPPVLSTLTAGSGVSIVNGPGSITISSSGGFSWTEITVVGPTSMPVNEGFIANNNSRVRLTLPATAAIGDRVRVTGKGSGGWRIEQNAGQQVFFGSQTSSMGAAGRLDSTQQRDSVELVCITANDEWNVISAVGNIDVV